MIDIIPNWHPILVHFTIGLLATSVGFYLLSIVIPVSKTLKDNWQVVARWCLWSGMGMTLFTLLAGYFAYNSVAHDTPSHEAMTEHRNWAFATAAAFAGLTIWSIAIHLKNKLPGKAFLATALVCVGLLASTGWHGGEAVYRYGLGVMSLPQTNTESADGGHSHQHTGDTSSATHSEKEPLTDKAGHSEMKQPHAH